jgi:hypothetical protein
MRSEKIRFGRGAATLAIVSLLAAAGQSVAAESPAHIWYIMMENHGYTELIGNSQAPYINSLAAKYAVATNYYGITHPSEPNYLAAVSGSFQGVWDDCQAGSTVTCTPEEFWPADIIALNGPNDATDADPMTDAQYSAASVVPHVFLGNTIADELNQSGRSWKAYMQALPKSPSQGDLTPANEIVYWPNFVPADGGGQVQVKLYAEKHNPFLYFANVRNDASQLARIVPYDDGQGHGFMADLKSGNVPAFSFVVPDQCADMHGISTAATAWAVAHYNANYAGCDADFANVNSPPPAAPNVVTIGDAFLRQAVTAIQASSAWRSGRNYIIITWDEDDYSGFAGCCSSPRNSDTGAVLGGARVPTIVISNGPQPLHVNPLPGNHYTLLGAIQTLWELPCLENTCNFYNRTAMLPLFY